MIRSDAGMNTVPGEIPTTLITATPWPGKAHGIGSYGARGPGPPLIDRPENTCRGAEIDDSKL